MVLLVVVAVVEVAAAEVVVTLRKAVRISKNIQFILVLEDLKIQILLL